MEKTGKIFVDNIEEKTWNDKKFWEISGNYTDQDMAFKGTVWNQDLKDKIKMEADNYLAWTESERNGYTNRKIGNVGNADGTFSQPSKSAGGRVAKADPAKTKSIERQVAAKEAVQLIAANVVEFKDFESAAYTILAFIKGEDDDGKAKD